MSTFTFSIICICPPFSLHWLKTNVYFFALSLIAVSRLNLQLLLGYTILYVVSTSLQSVYKKILLLILKEIYHFHFFYILQVSVINSIDTSHEDMIVSHLEYKIYTNKLYTHVQYFRRWVPVFEFWASTVYNLHIYYIWEIFYFSKFLFVHFVFCLS